MSIILAKPEKGNSSGSARSDEGSKTSEANLLPHDITDAALNRTRATPTGAANAGVCGKGCTDAVAQTSLDFKRRMKETTVTSVTFKKKICCEVT
jgi:hypothetical protein